MARIHLFKLVPTKSGYSLKLGRETMLYIWKTHGLYIHRSRHSFGNFPFFQRILAYALNVASKEPQETTEISSMYGRNGHFLTHYPYI